MALAHDRNRVLRGPRFELGSTPPQGAMLPGYTIPPNFWEKFDQNLPNGSVLLYPPLNSFINWEFKNSMRMPGFEPGSDAPKAPMLDQTTPHSHSSLKELELVKLFKDLQDWK